MKGKILDYSVQTNTAIIRTEDQKHYSFLGSAWREWIVPMPGMHVYFELDAQGEVTEVFIDVPEEDTPIAKPILTPVKAFTTAPLMVDMQDKQHHTMLEKEVHYCMIDWAIKCFKNALDFKGRARRQEFWSFQFFYAVLGVSMLAFGHFLDLGHTLFIVSSIFMLLPALAVSVRRLHDINRSGWLLLINLVPIVGVLIVIFFFMTEEGDSRANAFGPPSK